MDPGAAAREAVREARGKEGPVNRIVLAVFVVSALVATLATCDRHPLESVCLPGSLHDHIVRQWSNIFLSLMADGGIYEFEPAQPRQTSP
jgi:hypothetical protein